MRALSPAGVVLGGIVDVGASFGVFLVALFVRAVHLGASATGLSQADRERIVRAAYDALASDRSATDLAVSWCLGALCSVAGGYVAARVAGRGHVLNGALSAALSIGLVVAGFAAQPASAVDALTIAGLFAAPLLGAFGGYLRLREVRADEPAPVTWGFE